MLACIPTNGNRGRDDTICAHFGSAPFFTLYNSESHDIEIVENRNAHHSHGTCHPMNQLATHDIDAVVCSGMGRRAIEALNAEGVRIIDARTESVAEAMAKIDAGDLVDVDPSRACRGRGQHAAFGHEPETETAPGTGQGRGRGAGIGQGQGSGRGRGQGMGQGRGRGMGRGGGRGRRGQ